MVSKDYERLDRLMRRAHIPMSLIAKHLGISRATMYTWSQGCGQPTKENTKRIIAVCEKLEAAFAIGKLPVFDVATQVAMILS